MVQKKLNFNQPILSVRRNSPKMTSQIVDERKGNNDFPLIHWLPPHRSEPNSGPVSNSGAVPFQWEQIPGQPKEVASTTSDNEIKTVSQISSEILKSPVVDGFDLDADASETMNQVKGLESAAATTSAGRLQQEEEKKRKVINQDKDVVVHCRPHFERRFFHYNKKEEKEGSDDDEDQHENVITVCCLLPRSCLKSSVCNLNPVPVTSLMNRIMTFPASRMMSGSSSISSSSTDSENEYVVKRVDNTRVDQLKETEVVKDHTPCMKSFKTLQELMADDGGLKLEISDTDLFHDDSETNIKTSDEMNMNEEPSSEEEEEEEDDDEEDMHIRIAVNKAANNAKKQLLRARTLGNAHNFGVVTPPLPESPSDSWLVRTLPSVSAKKATRALHSYVGSATSSGSCEGSNVES